MYYVDVEDFVKNISYYLELCKKEDVQITNNDKVVAVLSGPDKQSYGDLIDLCGSLKEHDTGEDYKEIIGNEIWERCGFGKS